MVGVHDLENNFESGRKITTPRFIYIHPDWHPGTMIYDADIAAIILEHEVTLEESTMPICLWNFSNDPAETVGTVIGYGKSENESKPYETIPKELEVPILTNDNCLELAPAIARIKSKNSFCAGSADGTGPCNGKKFII